MSDHQDKNNEIVAVTEETPSLIPDGLYGEIVEGDAEAENFKYFIVDAFHKYLYSVKLQIKSMDERVNNIKNIHERVLQSERPNDLKYLRENMIKEIKGLGHSLFVMEPKLLRMKEGHEIYKRSIETETASMMEDSINYIRMDVNNRLHVFDNLRERIKEDFISWVKWMYLIVSGEEPKEDILVEIVNTGVFPPPDYQDGEHITNTVKEIRAKHVQKTIELVNFKHKIITEVGNGLRQLNGMINHIFYNVIEGNKFRETELKYFDDSIFETQEESWKDLRANNGSYPIAAEEEIRKKKKRSIGLHLSLVVVGLLFVWFAVSYEFKVRNLMWIG